ncbi:hypothetical protein CHCC14819_1825 [Bacillus licheniformis]|nr:hypothetical protein CHCC14819_1825 [Bacillus licheniformis]TWM43559.1 hypothetical protein CHCC14818_3332 [Bacillus licheniformis]
MNGACLHVAILKIWTDISHVKRLNVRFCFVQIGFVPGTEAQANHRRRFSIRDT